MQGVHGRLELLAQGDELGGALGKSRYVLRLCKRKRLFKAAQNIRLVRLVRMQFQTKFADPDAVQTLFDDVERRFLLRDKQHFLPVRKSICNDICDRLALARSGRTVQDKARACARERNCRILRAVRRKRQ